MIFTSLLKQQKRIFSYFSTRFPRFVPNYETEKEQQDGMGRSPSFTFQVIFWMFANVEKQVTRPFILVLYINLIRASVGIRCYCLTKGPRRYMTNFVKMPTVSACLLYTTVYSTLTVLISNNLSACLLYTTVYSTLTVLISNNLQELLTQLQIKMVSGQSPPGNFTAKKPPRHQTRRER